MKQQSGFSLVEIAVVLVIIGLILGGLLGPLGQRVEQSKLESTASQLDDIIEAIYGFALINGRLPCPDTNGDGLENLTGTNCTNASGEPPATTLGTTRWDAWGQTIVYRVDVSFANNVLTGGTTNPSPFPAGCVAATNASFSMCSTGDINVTDGANAVAQGVPAIVVSRGKAKDPAATHVDENENTDTDVDFVSRDFRPENAPNPFNDVVRWIPANVLIGKMVQAQRLP